MSQQKPVLGYWKIRALGQPIRFLLHYLEIDYDEKYYDLTPELTKDEWYVERDTLGLPFPNLPYLLDGPRRVTETRAIMKYLCRTRKPELLGKTEEVQTKIDMVDNFMYDLMYSGLIPVVYHYSEEKLQQYKKLAPLKLGYLSDFIKGNQWAAGSELSYADFFTYETLYHLTMFDPTCLDNFPVLKEYMARFEKLPAMQKFMSSPTFIKAPVYGRNAAYKM